MRAMLSVKVSSKRQVSIPSEACNRLGIKPGDRLTVQIRDDELVMRRRPAKASERLRGLGRGMYGPDPTAFVRALRDEVEEHERELDGRVGR